MAGAAQGLVGQPALGMASQAVSFAKAPECALIADVVFFRSFIAIVKMKRRKVGCNCPQQCLCS